MTTSPGDLAQDGARHALGAFVERVGSATLRHIGYVGAIVIQLRNTVAALGRTLPLVGNRNRWVAAVRQMLAVGVDAFPGGGCPPPGFWATAARADRLKHMTQRPEEKNTLRIIAGD